MLHQEDLVMEVDSVADQRPGPSLNDKGEQAGGYADAAEGHQPGQEGAGTGSRVACLHRI